MEAEKRRRLVQPSRGSGGGVVRLSTCDLALPDVYAMAIFAFGVEGLGLGGAVEMAALERGLREVLNEYPEWAGRLRSVASDEVVIELTDAGVALVEASMESVSLDDLMPFDPSPILFDLVPPTRDVRELLLVQVTRFKCGGIVVGVAWHHRLADGQAFFAFMNNWSRMSRAAAIAAPPFRDRSPLIVTAGDSAPPPLSDEYRLLSPSPPLPPSPPESALSAKKFHFTPAALQRLKREASSGDDISAVTTFESLTAHLWRCITAARELGGDVRTQMMIPMDARSRLDPPLPESFFGNATFAPVTSGVAAAELLASPLGFAAKLVHDAIKKANACYLRSALESMRAQQLRAAAEAEAGGVVMVPPGMSPDVCVSSWVRFPLYEVDFGWGAPLFVGNVLDLFEGIMVLLPSHTRDGAIDAVVALLEPAMAKLDEELRSTEEDEDPGECAARTVGCEQRP